MATMVKLAAVLLFAVFCCVNSQENSCHPCACRHNPSYGGTEVVCSALNLTDVPRLSHLSNVISLLLNRNKFQVLETGAFQQFVNLSNLDLSNNNISDIEINAFEGLSCLDVLRLDSNHLLSINDTDYDVFSHLNQLQVLNLGGTGISVSGRQIVGLISLRELHVDCQDCIFHRNFSQLSYLTNLTFVQCAKGRLANSTFISVPHLQSLDLSDCHIESIEAGTFEPLKNLTFLDISTNLKLGLTEFTKSIYGLRNSPIQCIKANSVTSVKTTVGPLQKDAFMYLKNTSLEQLHMDGNVIAYVASGSLGLLPNTLRVLSFRKSLLGDFDWGNFSNLFFIQSLQTLNVDGTIMWDPSNGPSNWHYSKLPRLIMTLQHLENINLANRFFYSDINEHIIFPQNVLKTIVLRGNLITSITGPFSGLDSVTAIDASNNIIYKLGSEFVSINNSLSYFNVSNNNLGSCFEHDKNGDIFAKRSQITVLDISNNRITYLTKHIFKGLKHVKYLNISNNVLFTFGVTLRHMTNLQRLDLSNNKLQLLSVDTQKDLDVLKKTVANLEDNPLACSCQSLQFLQWVRVRKESIHGLRNITCQLPNGTRAHLNDIDSIVSQLEKQCSSNVVLITVTVSSIMCVLVVVGVIAGYRNRWKLRYLYHVGRRGYQVQKNDEEVNYRYDAFVSYADEDRGFVINTLIPELEQKSGLKLCIHHRDFLPGAVISENIVVSIQNSRKTLLVLTPAFLESEWCSYEFNMALVDGISRKQNTIVTVMYKQVDMKDVPKDLAVMLSNNSYLEYNTDLHGGVVFWNKMLESLSTTQPLH